MYSQSLSFGEIRKGIERLPTGKRRTELEEWLKNDLDHWFEERLLPVTKASLNGGEFFQPRQTFAQILVFAIFWRAEPLCIAKWSVLSLFIKYCGSSFEA